MKIVYRGLFVLVVLGLIVVPIVAQEEDVFDPDAAESIAEVETQVADMRELTPSEPVERVAWTRERVVAWLEEQINTFYSPEEARDDAIVYSALDFMPPDTDLWQLQLDLLSEQVGGFYDPETKSMVILDLGKGFDALAEVTYAHEFTHALQDQHFDLNSLGLGADADPDQSADLVLARQALVEGDATQVMQDYMVWRVEAEDGLLFSTRLFAVLGELEMAQFESAPPITNAEMLFPYLKGQAFVQDVLNRGGWVLLNAVYERPPLSTEQILHPQQYFDGDEPQIVELTLPDTELGKAWQLIDDDVLGEFYLLEYLDQHLPQSDAAAAAAGWGGDRLAVYYNDENGTTAWLYGLSWDALSEAQEFIEHFTVFIQTRYDVETPVYIDDSDNSEPTCWAGSALMPGTESAEVLREDATCLYHTGSNTLIVQAPDVETAQAIGDMQDLGPQ